MFYNFLTVAGQVVTLFLLMGVGFVLAELGKLYGDGIAQMSTLVLYIVSPCVIIDAFSIERTSGMLMRLGQFGLFYTLSSLFCVAVSLLFFRGEPPLRKGPIRFSMVYGNNGFMGLPLLLSIMGQDAVIYGVVSLVVFNLLMWSHGVAVMGGRVTLRQALVNPATVGLAVALPLFLTGARLPSMVGNAVGFMADLNTPLAMVVIGAQMAGSDLKASFTSLRLYGIAAFRLLLAPLVPLLLMLPFHPDPMLYCSVVVMCAVPSAGATGMLAERFQRDTAVAAQIVTLTTLLSVLTLPLMVVAAQWLSGMI